LTLRGRTRSSMIKYKPLIGSATAQTIIRKNDDAWKSFFRLLKLKREGRLPPFMKKVSPPGYKKKRKSRTLWTIIRKDQYEMDGDRIIIKWLGAIGWIETKYKGPVYLRGERGELMIRYDDDRKRWYAQHCFLQDLREDGEGRVEECRCNRKAI